MALRFSCAWSGGAVDSLDIQRGGTLDPYLFVFLSQLQKASCSHILCCGVGVSASASLVDKRLSTASRSHCLKMKDMPLPSRSQVQSTISLSTRWLIQPDAVGHETCRNLA